MIFENLQYAAPLVFFAAIVRAYTGFGFAAVAIIGLNLMWPPQVSVPVILLIDTLCGLTLVPSAWKQVEFSTLKQLFQGAILGAPTGLLALIFIPELWIKIATSLFVLAISIKLACRTPAELKPLTPLKNRMMGTLSGAITAAASVGGPPLVAYFMGSDIEPKKQRALLMIFFVCSSLLSLLLMTLTGMIGLSILLPVAILLLPALAGAYIGQKLFHIRQPSSFKPVVIPLLIGMALISLVVNFNQLDLNSFS